MFLPGAPIGLPAVPLRSPYSTALWPWLRNPRFDQRRRSQRRATARTWARRPAPVAPSAAARRSGAQLTWPESRRRRPAARGARRRLARSGSARGRTRSRPRSGSKPRIRNVRRRRRRSSRSSDSATCSGVPTSAVVLPAAPVAAAIARPEALVVVPRLARRDRAAAASRRSAAAPGSSRRRRSATIRSRMDARLVPGRVLGRAEDGPHGDAEARGSPGRRRGADLGDRPRRMAATGSPQSA